MTLTRDDELSVESGKGAGDEALGVTGSDGDADDMGGVLIAPYPTRGIFGDGGQETTFLVIVDAQNRLLVALQKLETEIVMEISWVAILSGLLHRIFRNGLGSTCFTSWILRVFVIL